MADKMDYQRRVKFYNNVCAFFKWEIRRKFFKRNIQGNGKRSKNTYPTDLF